MTMGCEEPAPPIIWALITFEMEKVVNLVYDGQHVQGGQFVPRMVNLFEDGQRVGQKCVIAPEAVAHSAVWESGGSPLWV